MNMKMDDIILKIKEKPGVYLGGGFAFLIVIFFYISSIGSESSITDKEREKAIVDSKTAKSSIETKNNKPKTEQELEAEKLKVSTNPEARAGALEKEVSKYENPKESVLKTKYSNSEVDHEKEKLEIKKKEEEIKKKELEKEAEVAEIKKRHQDEIEALKKEKKQEEIQIEKERVRQELERKNPMTVTMTAELRAALITEALAEGKLKPSSMVKTIKLPEKIDENISSTNPQTPTNEQKFKFVAGSSFFGRLTNLLYSLYPQAGAIIKLEHRDVENCNFLGTVENSSPEGLSIKLYKMACADGYEQAINGYAFRVNDLKPVFADKIERHLLPKIVIGTLDILLTQQRETTTTSGGAVISKNTNLMDQILQDELARYRTETIVNPQSVVVIFY